MLILLLPACLGLQTLEPPDKKQGDTASTVSLGGVEVSTTTIDFGDVDLEATISEPVTLHNAGAASVSVSAWLTGSNRFELDAASVDVGAGADAVITVRFTPDMESSFEGSLSLETDDGASATVTLTGRGLEGGDTGSPEDSGSTTTPSGDPDIGVSATSLDYGTVDVGDTLSRTVSVTNDGDADLEIDAATVSSSAFTVSGDFTTDRTLAPGASKTLQVDFKPTAAGNFSGYVELSSNDPDSPSTRISLEGLAEEGCDVCAPQMEVETGGTDDYTIDDFFSLIGPDTRTVTIRNVGDEDLEVTDVSVTNDFLAPCGEFSLSGWSGAKTVAPSSSTTFSIAYDTSDVCLDVAQDSIGMNVVHIRSNDPGEPDYVIALAGTGF